MLLPKKYTIFGLVLALLGLAWFSAACSSSYEFKGSVIDPPLPLPDFELADTNGHSFHLSDVAGDYALIYFGYTFCPDICPLTMANVRQALADFKWRNRVHVIFISVDPERDTPELLGRYVKAFGPDFIGLTDDFEKTKAVMKPYGAFAEKQKVTNSAAGYLVNHTARLYLVDPNRNLILTYPFGFTSDDLRSDLTHLLQQ